MTKSRIANAGSVLFLFSKLIGLTVFPPVKPKVKVPSVAANRQITRPDTSFFLDRESPIEERSNVSNVSDFKADRALSLWRCLTVEIIERQGTINRLKEEFFWGKARADPGQMQEVIRVESNHVFASKTESIRFHNKIKTQKALVRLRAS